MLLALVSALLFSAPAQALVTPKNGNFAISYVDWEDPKDRSLKLERVYNSKSSFDGMFSYGWGTLFEGYLVRGPENGWMTLNEWGTGSRTFYPPGDSRLQRTGSGWERVTGADHGPQKGRRDLFSAKGLLTRMEYPDGRALTVSRDRKGKITALEREGIQLLVFERDAAGNVREVRTYDGKKALYRYGADGLLAYARDADGGEFWYEYDPAGRANLTRIHYANGTSKEIEYYGPDLNENVRSVREPEGTEARYSYRDMIETLTVESVFLDADGHEERRDVQEFEKSKEPAEAKARSFKARRPRVALEPPPARLEKSLADAVAAADESHPDSDSKRRALKILAGIAIGALIWGIRSMFVRPRARKPIKKSGRG